MDTVRARCVTDRSSASILTSGWSYGTGMTGYVIFNSLLDTTDVMSEILHLLDVEHAHCQKSHHSSLITGMA